MILDEKLSSIYILGVDYYKHLEMNFFIFSNSTCLEVLKLHILGEKY
jgi:hypothetical protein